MAQMLMAGFLDRLLHDFRADGGGNGSDQTPAQFKNSVARDLEAMLNTRRVFPEHLQSAYPESAGSILGYGLMDFSHLCLGSSADREAICAAVKTAIERHEPRLRQVRASLRVTPGSARRLEFIIEAVLQTRETAEPVQFDAQFDTTTQQYAIHGSLAEPGAA